MIAQGAARPARRLHGRLLIVAGSDSGGGAGLQADLKTATVMGVYAMTAVTAVTAQDTHRIHAVEPVTPEVVGLQMRTALDDIGADAVKTGMLVSTSTIHAISTTLSRHGEGIPVVVDPVMIASDGTPLLAPTAENTLRECLLPHAFLVTPNAPEAGRLTGLPVTNCDEMIRAGQRLIAMGASAALVTGGHIAGDHVVDLLITENGVDRFVADRLDTGHTHGTGCTLASGISASIAQGLTLLDATARAHAYVQRAIQSAPKLGGGHGPLNHWA